MLFFFLFVLEALSDSVSCTLRLWVRCMHIRDRQGFLENWPLCDTVSLFV